VRCSSTSATKPVSQSGELEGVAIIPLPKYLPIAQEVVGNPPSYRRLKSRSNCGSVYSHARELPIMFFVAPSRANKLEIE